MRRTIWQGRWLSQLISWTVVPLFLVGVFFQLALRGIEDPTSDPVLYVGFGAFAVVGAMLVAKRPGNPIGWIMAAVGLMVAFFPAGEIYADYVMTTRGRPDLLAIAGVWVQGWYWYLLLSMAIIFLPLLFPDGRLPSRRWIPVAGVAGIATAATVLLWATRETLGEEYGYRIDNPIGIEGLAQVEELPIFGTLTFLLLIGILGAGASVFVRYKRARAAERQQLKWFLYAVSLMSVLVIMDFLPVPDLVENLGLGVVLVALPTSIGIAILRYRLYDIDLVINRTLVYGALTALLGAVYVAGVVLMPQVLPIARDSDLVVAGSTLAVAGLFSPLRRKIKAFVDRRFYRSRYDARRTVEAFAARLRDEVDLETLQTDLVEVVRQTLQPAHVSLWLRESQRRVLS